jgi:hypothetical protein
MCFPQRRNYFWPLCPLHRRLHPAGFIAPI